MGMDEFLYSVGEGAERFFISLKGFLLELVSPSPKEEPPAFSILRKVIRKDLTVHEFLSLRLQLVFLAYLLASLVIAMVSRSVVYLLVAFLFEFECVRLEVNWHREFFVDVGPYKFFYYWISIISFAAFGGYLLIRRMANDVVYVMGYLVVILVVVLLFRWYFKQRYGRDYTYGIIEEVKNDLVKVFVHDDIAANIKPGYYWVEKVPDAEPGRVVKLLLEDRKLRGAVPSRILEVYLESQSSQTSSEPKKARE